MQTTLLTIAMLAAFALIAGGARMLRADRTKGVLMIVCALVIVGNVAIATV